MEIYEDRVGGDVSFRLVGDFTFRDMQSFDRCATLLREEPIESAHFDLTEIRILETTAVGLLLIVAEDAQHRGVSLTMTPPTVEPARQMLQMCRVDSVFPFAAV